jgi:hydrogenase-4 component B
MISPILLTVTGILLALTAGIPLLARGNPRQQQKLAASLQLLATAFGLTGATMALIAGEGETWQINWGLPFGPGEIALDPLSALFLFPIFIVSGCCAVYALGYWPARDNPETTPRLTLFFSILTASLVLIVIARHALVFIAAWEIMTVVCYFAMTVEGRKKEVRDAGILYLVVGHLGILALFAFFALVKGASGSWLLPAAGSLPAGAGGSTAIFIAALAAFGIKAGIVPLHIWLPSAHANAPSHVSAIMSGVLIKMGIYGMIRTVSLFSDIPFWWGVLILALGVVSGLVGVVFAIGQHDIKRLLAYHSIENIGIILMGVGVALMGVSNNIPALVMLGMAGALLHTVNHATFKSLLFLGAGSVIHACGTREIDRMGGLLRSMPFTAAFFLTGAVAICGLPPLNGFVSEWLVYLGLFRGIIDADTFNDPYFALAAPALALIGGLAVACFVKVFGIAFLGAPRHERTEHPHEAPATMLFPMGALAGICAAIGLFPQAVSPLLERVTLSLFPHLSERGTTLAPLASLHMVSLGSLLLLLLLGGLVLLYRRRLARSPRGSAETWGCGYLAPTPRMQYTASSFAATLVGLFSGLLRTHVKRPQILGHFPRPVAFRSHVPEALLEGFYLPLFALLNNRLSLVRRLQHGKLHLYILYIVVTLVALLAWSHFKVRS